MMMNKIIFMLVFIFFQCGYFKDLGLSVEKKEAGLTGQVVDSLSLKPISGAKVYLANQSTTTDNNGYFILDSVFTGNKTLWIEFNNYILWHDSLALTKGVHNLGPIPLKRINRPPSIRNVVFPKHDMANAPLSIRLTFTCRDSDFLINTSLEHIHYSITLDTVKQSRIIDSGELSNTEQTFQLEKVMSSKVIGSLLPNRRYYWTIDFKDVFGQTSQPFIDSFITRSSPLNPDSICPLGMAFVEVDSHHFCMDKYEVTNNDFAVYDSMEYRLDSVNYNIHEPELLSKSPNMPRTNIPFELAENYCLNTKKRLCFPTEWKLALGGWEASLYPYGNEYDPGKCNTERNAFLLPDDGGGADSVGKRKSCVSKFGIYDLSGNASEWVYYADDRSYYNPPDNIKEWRILYAGGDWSSQSRSNILTFDSIKEVSPKYFIAKNIGFRCCSNTRR